MRSNVTSRLAFIACLPAVLGVGCKDAYYRHEISGVVVNAEGAPMGSAVVTRVNQKNEPYGMPELYQTRTDAEGRFAFIKEGRGPQPSKVAPWRLAVDKPGGARVFYDVDAPWVDPGPNLPPPPPVAERKPAATAAPIPGDSPLVQCRGYCLQGLSLKLPP
jgi:hypothetical protein